eukprot:CAMPEP_0184478722 /NCGR_PEP_ID=MMETSP0113_2-20130426/672_1 /TAXON_ID=91329 /ORGANISM="Norrisiella sphaerica, Strain BC52" /LENGTH=253 /DNA_ID=CAMNT_0026856609 /DNA_START=223 /DNA_END=984 /DNA_ORIENTATION=+
MADKLDKSLDEIFSNRTKRGEDEEERDGIRGRNRTVRRGRKARQNMRTHPYRRSNPHIAGGNEPEHTNLMQVVKVSGESNARSIASAIANTSRNAEAPTVLATGPLAINQAIKAITIARTYLEDDGIDLRAHCEFEDVKGFKTKIQLSKARSKPRGPKINKDDLCVKKSSDPFKVAGAIAARVRDMGKAVGVYAKGSEAVSIMIKSVYISCNYLDEDNLGLLFVPTFMELENKIGDTMQSSTYLKLTLLMHQL